MSGDDKKVLAVDPLGREILMPETTEVDRYPAELTTLLQFVAIYMGFEDDVEGWANQVFVSDMSSLGDFGLNESDLDLLGGKLGFTVTNKDRIHEITLQMRGIC